MCSCKRCIVESVRTDGQADRRKRGGTSMQARHIAFLCNTVQHSATQCNIVQHTATHFKRHDERERERAREREKKRE